MLILRQIREGEAMKETAEWWVQKCLAAAEAAAKAAALTPDEDPTGMPVYDKDGEVDVARAEKWLAWAMTGGKGMQTQAEAASAAFQREMPPLVSRGHTKAFIACVATGLGHKYLTALESKSLMYSAQLALAAFRPRERNKHTTPTRSEGGYDKTTPAAEVLRAQNRGKR